MGLETGNTINDLNESWPLGTDPKSQGDDHIRLCKRVFKNDVLSTTNGGTISGDVDFAGDVNFAGNVTGLVQAANPSLIINGGFDVWQRGTSFTAGSYSPAYTSDRWSTYSPASTTVTKQTTNEVDGVSYFIRVNDTTAAPGIRQGIELPEAGNAGVFKSGSVFTLSFYAKADYATDIGTYIRFQDENNSGANAVVVDITPSIATLSGNWQKVTRTFTISASPNPTNLCLSVGLLAGNAGGSVDITAFKLEQGSVATPWFCEDIGTTLAKCQRYYQKSYNKDAFAGANEFSGVRTFLNTGTIGTKYAFALLATMRVPPSITIYRKNGGATNSAQRNVTDANYIALIAIQPSDNGFYFQIDEAGTPDATYGFHFLADAEL